MPITRREYSERPYVRPAYEPDTRTLLQLMQMAGMSRAQAAGQKGQLKAQGLMRLGDILSQGLGNLRQGKEREQAAAFESRKYEDEQARYRRAEELQRAQLESLHMDRQADNARQAEAARVAQEATAYRRGGDVAEEVQYGPMSEAQLESVMQGPAAGRARYVFGPGTAEGPELQPTQGQSAVLGMGGQIGPKGEALMPPKPTLPNLRPEDVLLDGQPTKAVFNPQTGTYAVNGQDVTARVKPMPRSPAATFTIQQQTREDAEGIAERIINGLDPPVVSTRFEGPVRAAIARLDPTFDLSRARNDWQGVQRHVSAMNSVSQVRLRQTAYSALNSLDYLEQVLDQYEALGGGVQVKKWNEFRNWAAEQGLSSPEYTDAFRMMNALITDQESEVATVYRGGNSPTDATLLRAAQNLNTNWSAPSMRKNIALQKKQLNLRLQAIEQARPVGTDGGENLYTPPRKPNTGGGGAAADPAGIRRPGGG